MEFGKDILGVIALDLNYYDILSLCSSHSRFNNRICQNNAFWYNKIKRDFPKEINEIDKNKNNYREIYEDLKSKFPVILKDEYKSFFLNNLKGIANINRIFLVDAIRPYIHDGIISWDVLIKLFFIYLRKFEVDNLRKEFPSLLDSRYDNLRKEDLRKLAIKITKEPEDNTIDLSDVLVVKDLDEWISQSFNI